MYKKTNQTYKYRINASIVRNGLDDYSLSVEEYYRLYSFYVTYSLCGNQSIKKRYFVDYGWPSNSIKGTNLGKELHSLIDLRNNSHFCFSKENNLIEKFEELDLQDGIISNLEYERAVIGITNGDNNYLKLFYRIRDGFAHGRFNLRYSSQYEKMVVIQDNDSVNVTARIVIKLETLLNFIDVIDMNGII